MFLVILGYYEVLNTMEKRNWFKNNSYIWTQNHF